MCRKLGCNWKPLRHNSWVETPKTLCTKNIKCISKHKTLKYIKSKRKDPKIETQIQENQRKRYKNWNTSISKHIKHNIKNKNEVLYQNTKNTKQKGGLKCLPFFERTSNLFIVSFYQCIMDNNDNDSLPFESSFHGNIPSWSHKHFWHD